ncbi:5-formyltetrahydrofolate cyclo-ligase [Legionella micdadei]|uniref:5-formyltetrahydrofolate cyclo-ligase n=1 Tax=Legionella micdadei TaxID=451 RepID=A0A098GH35_LEGMI|nr:5-formyltetrahydrofolate cyclo-ligase [Legionella micdadei]ARG96811.1 5-formyltetrahydrofolate cyclo-ligase [Legionella micdadei]ARG99543.1 5-formyltetrahydrofolate cyclo-ligase [Legionella micdadei]KTD26484.1 5-formyltetrahydrofolate cyclo-ligase [Legionella micdadei]NSL17925.1 5-formyltetrahydrofolate cyclo-ligase [Legionella micdadei]CEG61798.1 5-formyltetrahydrofolate cyclo-ligase [Legionella micdadei]
MPNRFKLALRRSCRQIRENLPLEYQHTASARVCTRIRGMHEYRHAKRIALYQATRGEISLNALWNSAPLQGKFCYFPVLRENKTLLFLPATPATPFVKNRYGIDEPDVDTSQAIEPKSLDIIFMPLVVFDHYGTRLGMGAGYYDRTLAKEDHPMLVGVAYEFQRYPYIEPHTWDIPLTAVVTEKTVHWSKIKND